MNLTQAAPLPRYLRAGPNLRPRPRFPAPIGSKACTMPADYGFRFDDLQCVHNIRSERIKPGKHKPVDAAERDATGISAAKHIQLVPEH